MVDKELRQSKFKKNGHISYRFSDSINYDESFIIICFVHIIIEAAFYIVGKSKKKKNEKK